MILKARLWGVLLFLISFTATGQKQISIDDFTSYNTFNAKWVTGINWMTDGKFYTSLVENMILKFNVTTGERVDTIFNAKEFPSLEIGNYSFSGDEKKLLIASEIKNIYRRSFVAEYFVYDIPSKNLKKLSSNGKQSYASFSPDGTRIAFVRNNNIFYVSLADMSEVQVTDDGKFNSIINGTTDWVYEEEFAFVDGFFWSPDGKTIAYYRFNETDVKEYTLQIWGKKSYPAEYKFKYPKAGETNSTVEIWFYNVASRTKTKADLGSEQDFYIPKVKWTQDPEVFAVRKLNRLQNHLELLHVNSRTGESKLVLDEKSDTYIEAKFVDELLYFRDGKHLVTTSEKSGYKHIYIYSTEGKLIQQVTSGDFEVTTLVGADEKTKTVYFISTEGSSLDRHFYAIQFDGKKNRG